MGHPYSNEYASPFPSLPVIVHPPEGVSTSDTLPALLDTGADGTLVPVTLLQAIHADGIHTARMRSHWGVSRPVTIYLVDMDVAGFRLPGVEVIGDDQSNEILLGRNVLNKLVLLLDGPAKTTSILLNRPLHL